MQITMLNGVAGYPNPLGLTRTFGLGAITFSTEPTSDWTCADWKFWHEELVKAFKAGRFASGIKYSDADAIRLANQVFNIWWSRLSSFISKHQFCGYESSFFNYFKTVGLDNILSYFQAVITPTAEAAGNVASNASQTVTKVSEVASNTATVAKWIAPALLTVAAVGLGWYLYKNHIQGNQKLNFSKAKEKSE